MKKLAITSLVLSSVLWAGCTATEQGAGYGGLGGAAIGGALGGWKGAAIGGAAGAVTGTLVGSAVDSSDERKRQNAPCQAAPPPPQAAAPAYPVGIRTDQPGYVKSPHNPNGPMVDVRGYAPGTVVTDPTTGRNFIVP